MGTPLVPAGHEGREVIPWLIRNGRPKDRESAAGVAPAGLVLTLVAVAIVVGIVLIVLYTGGSGGGGGGGGY
jgi:hypothetical protein